MSFSAVWRPITLTMLVAFGLSSQQAQAYSDDWLMGFHDSRHTGQTSEVVTPPLTVAWTWTDTYTYDNGNGGKFHPQPAFWLPIYYGGKVCFQGGLNANRVFCLNPADGTKMWENDNPGYTASGTYLFQFDNYPAVAAGRLMYVSSDYTATVDAQAGLDYHNLYNINGGWPAGGLASWNGLAYEQFIRYDDRPYPTEQFSIIPDPSNLSFATIAGNYQAPDNVTTFTDPFFRVPAVDGGVAYANFLGRLEAWDAFTHMPLWVWGSSNYGSSPAVANGVVYFYSVPTSTLVALKASPTGIVSTLWSANILGAKSPIVSDGVVYVGSSDTNFYALDAATGATKWSFATKAPFTSSQIPAISGDLIYVPGADGNLYILQKSTGVEVGRYSGTAAWGPVVIGGGKVYASDLTSKFYAFRPQTAAMGPSETSVSLSRATNNQAITVNLTGSGFFAGGSASAVQSIALDNTAGTVLKGYTVVSDQAITGVVVPAGIFPGIYHIKVRTNVGSTANEPVFEVGAANSNLISTLGQSPGLYGTGSQYGNQRHLVRTSNGTLIAVYIGPQGSSWRPATYNISHDGGLTWTGQAQLLNAIIYAPSSSVWVDRQDHLNVSYLIGYQQALAKFAVGQSDLLALDPGFPVVASPQDNLAQPGPMVSESGGRLWVAYKTTAQYDPPGNVMALYSDDGGLTWTRTPQITAAGSSPALILYQDKPAALYSENGFLVWAAWNGQQWSATQILPGAISGVQQSPSAVVTSNGQIQVAYVAASGGVHYVSYAGSSWSTPQTLDAAGNSPSLTTDGTSLWCFYANSTGDLAYRRTSNGQWNPAIAVTSDGNYNTSPATLTLSPDSLVPVIWTSGASASGYVLKSAVIPGDSAQAPLSPALGITETPTGNFTQGQIGAGYTVTVSNNTSAGPSSGTVTVTDTMPTGFTLVSMAGSGWGCSWNTCARSDVLNASLSYPAITVTVNVSPSAPSPGTNQVSVSGGNSGPASASNAAVVIAAPILSILEAHSGNFSPGQTAAVCTATVSNQAGAGPTSGMVTVTGTTPVGLTLVSMAGSGWVCSGNTCTRADVLNAGATYPAIAVTVNVAASAPSSVTNQVSVSGGNSGPANAGDTAVVVTSPILSILETHIGTFSQGQTAAVYTATVSNQAGAGPTSGTVTVTETMPVGLTLVSMAGSGWVCSGNTCTRADVLNAGATYPAIAVTVNVAASAPSSVTNQVSVSGGNSVPANASNIALVVTSPILTGTGSFVKTDTTTAGSWKGVYGADGVNVINDTASYPAYVSATASGNTSYTWAPSTTDARGMQKGSSASDRIAACWYAFGSLSIDLRFNDSGTHQVALYLLDWDNYLGRSERVDILDANNTVLDSRSVSAFTGGEYLVWNLSGHVTVRVTNLNPNAGSTVVVSGLLFGPGGASAPAPAPTGTGSFVKTDTTTAGSWKGVYGADGVNVINDTASYPAYVSATASGNTSYTWAPSTTDARGMQKGSSASDRIAACWFAFGSLSIDLRFNDSGTHQVALYLLDWDNYLGRSERVDILDANNTVLDSRSVSAFFGGEYLVWNLSGHVTVRITNLNPKAGSTVVVSGLLFGPGGASAPAPTGTGSFVKTDTTTAGSWKGVYGADGFNVINDTASYPAYVSATASGNTSYTWAPSTTDARGMQKGSSASDRIAACWFAFGSLSIDLRFNDSGTHQVALYLMDWDNYLGRSERVDILDANNTVLDSRSVSAFFGGEYLVWNLSGHVTVRITNLNPKAGSTVVVSGILFR